jgi:hypothetical protein
VRPGWLRAYANTLVGASAADALLSLLDEVVRAATGATWLALPRSALAQLVVIGMATSVPVMLVTPRLPIAVFGPLALVTLWLALGAAPLQLWISSPEWLGIAGCLIQLVAVALAFALIRRRTGSWWFSDADSGVPAFAWRRSLGLGAVLVTLGPIAVAGYFALAVSTWVEVATRGFIDFGLAGVSLADRHYERAGQEIRLVGMMHLGDAEAYRAIVRTFSHESTIVLAEGVSDRDSRLVEQLEYGRAARALGLAPQQDLREYLTDPAEPEQGPAKWPVVRHADVDTSAFSPSTIAWIRWASRIWDAPDLVAALQELLAGVRGGDPAELAQLQAEILDLRNQNLTRELERALTEYRRVVVPWGALHLPAIEQTVLGWGFAETSRELHPLFGWSTIAAALL